MCSPELDNLQELESLSGSQLTRELDSRGWSDGLPMARPTVSAEKAMLHENGLLGSESVGRVPPFGAPSTVDAVAIQCLMAGCNSAHLPVLLACIRALQLPEFNALGVLTTTGSAACAILVSGPAARQLAFNGAANCLGPGNLRQRCGWSSSWPNNP